MTTEAWWKLCKVIISGILISAAAVIGFKYLLPTLLPFILAIAVSSCIRPCALWCKRRFKIGAGIVSALMILVIFTLVCVIVYSATARLLSECTKFLVNVSKSAGEKGSPISRLGELLGNIGERFSFTGDSDGGVDLYGILTGVINAGIQKISATFATWAAAFIRALPSALLSVGICFIAMLYLTLDYDGAVCAVRELLPKRGHSRAAEIYRKLTHALWEYLRAYLLIMLITFAELYLGFTILRIEYSFLFAIVIAAVDFLPLLGTGTVLIPWAASELLLGEYKRGIGILIIYGAVCVIRQLIEPRIVGNFIGTHPLVALLGVYTGLKLFGVIGMIAAPIILYLIKAMRKGEMPQSPAE